MSKALEKSKAMTVVRVGGLRWLNPRAMDSVIGKSAVVVDLTSLKPCCVSAKDRSVRKNGSSNRSRTFIAGERREMGRKEEP